MAQSTFERNLMNFSKKMPLKHFFSLVKLAGCVVATFGIPKASPYLQSAILCVEIFSAQFLILVLVCFSR